MENEKIKHYSNGEITIKWQPHLCVHSTVCFRGLPQVFDPSKRPWVNANGATTRDIIEQVDLCPSGALSYFVNEPEKIDKQETIANPVVRIDIMPGGPLILRGECNIRYADGTEGVTGNVSSFCRCGNSGKKPFCDGNHYDIGFSG